MNLSYVKISNDLIKFFYEDGKKYGEFYMRITRETQNQLNPKDSMGVRGTATIDWKDRDYAQDLSQSFADEMFGPERVVRVEDITREDE